MNIIRGLDYKKGANQDSDSSEEEYISQPATPKADVAETPSAPDRVCKLGLRVMAAARSGFVSPEMIDYSVQLESDVAKLEDGAAGMERQCHARSIPHHLNSDRVEMCRAIQSGSATLDKDYKDDEARSRAMRERVAATRRRRLARMRKDGEVILPLKKRLALALARKKKKKAALALSKTDADADAEFARKIESPRGREQRLRREERVRIRKQQRKNRRKFRVGVRSLAFRTSRTPRAPRVALSLPVCGGLKERELERSRPSSSRADTRPTSQLQQQRECVDVDVDKPEVSETQLETLETPEIEGESRDDVELISETDDTKLTSDDDDAEDVESVPVVMRRRRRPKTKTNTLRPMRRTVAAVFKQASSEFRWTKKKKVKNKKEEEEDNPNPDPLQEQEGTSSATPMMSLSRPIMTSSPLIMSQSPTGTRVPVRKKLFPSSPSTNTVAVGGRAVCPSEAFRRTASGRILVKIRHRSSKPKPVDIDVDAERPKMFSARRRNKERRMNMVLPADIVPGVLDKWVPYSSFDQEFDVSMLRRVTCAGQRPLRLERERVFRGAKASMVEKRMRRIRRRRLPLSVSVSRSRCSAGVSKKKKKRRRIQCTAVGIMKKKKVPRRPMKKLRVVVDDEQGERQEEEEVVLTVSRLKAQSIGARCETRRVELEKKEEEKHTQRRRQLQQPQSVFMHPGPSPVISARVRVLRKKKKEAKVVSSKTCAISRSLIRPISATASSSGSKRTLATLIGDSTRRKEMVVPSVMIDGRDRCRKLKKTRPQSAFVRRRKKKRMMMMTPIVGYCRESGYDNAGTDDYSHTTTKSEAIPPLLASLALTDRTCLRGVSISLPSSSSCAPQKMRKKRRPLLMREQREPDPDPPIFSVSQMRLFDPSRSRPGSTSRLCSSGISAPLVSANASFNSKIMRLLSVSTDLILRDDFRGARSVLLRSLRTDLHRAPMLLRALVHSNLGAICVLLKKYSRSMRYFALAMDLMQEGNDQPKRGFPLTPSKHQQKGSSRDGRIGGPVAEGELSSPFRKTPYSPSAASSARGGTSPLPPVRPGCTSVIPRAVVLTNAASVLLHAYDRPSVALDYFDLALVQLSYQHRVQQDLLAKTVLLIMAKAFRRTGESDKASLCLARVQDIQKRDETMRLRGKMPVVVKNRDGIDVLILVKPCG